MWIEAPMTSPFGESPLPLGGEHGGSRFESVHESFPVFLPIALVQTGRWLDPLRDPCGDTQLPSPVAPALINRLPDPSILVVFPESIHSFALKIVQSGYRRKMGPTRRADGTNRTGITLAQTPILPTHWEFLESCNNFIKLLLLPSSSVLDNPFHPVDDHCSHPPY